MAYVLLANVTIVGTLRKNKQYIPNEKRPSKNCTVTASLNCFRDNVSMANYASKTNKCVILLSTMHHDAYDYRILY